MFSIKKTCFFCFAVIAVFLAFTPFDSRAHVNKNTELFSFDAVKEIPAGDYAAFRYMPGLNKFAEVPVAGADTLKAHSELIGKTLERVPAWLKYDLEKKFTELVNCAVKVKANASVIFEDVNGDSRPDLIAGDSEGRVHAYVYPMWVENKEVFKNVSVSGNAAPCFLDMNSDGRKDIIVGSANGTLHVFFAPDFMPAYPNPLGHINVGSDAVPVVYGADNKIVIGNGKGELICSSDLTGHWKKSEIAVKGTKISFYRNGLNFDSDALNISRMFKEITAMEFPKGSGNIIPRVIDIDENGAGDLFVIDTGGNAVLGLEKSMGTAAQLLDNAVSFDFEDVTGDGLKDIVVGLKDGFVSFCRNTGLPGKPHFNVNCRDFVKMFDESGLGLATHPCASADNALVVGNKDGVISGIGTDLLTWSMNIKNIDCAAPALFSSIDKEIQGLVVGSADGSLRFFKYAPNILNAFNPYTEEPSVFSEIKAGEYAVPAFGDIDGDKDWDLVVGNLAGELKVFKNMETETGKPVFIDDSVNSSLAKIKADKSASPALCDVNADGIADLVLGAQNGTLKLYVSPEWKENTDALGETDLGELSAPAFFDANNDGKPDIVAGNAQGALLYYENVSTGSRLAWFEKFSMDLSGINDEKDESGEKNYYERYYPEMEYLFGANDSDTLSDYCKLLQDCKKEYVDEIAFSIANLPSEVLRTVSRMKESVVLLENAKGIYDIAKEIKYAAIKEHDDYTTLEYVIDSKTKKELDRDVYYWWIAHPRLGYEMPLKVDTTWWANPPEYYGMTKDEWLKHEPEQDMYALSAKSAFWRTLLPRDKSNAKTLLDAVKDSPTLRDAAENLHYWISCGSPDGFMSFGYLTSDSQPLVIHRKRYGSCGEQSIIAGACGRTMLIPTAVVTKRGEDHQWNEFYVDGKWYHWDICGWPSIDLPWDPEGRRHERGSCSTITRWWGNDYMDEVTTTVANTVSDYTKTGSGYTDTADVTVKVLDAKGRPVDGALAVIRSHDGTYRRISIWGYTDAGGRRTFRLGYKADGGFTIEIISPYGIAGTENFSVIEGRHYELTYNMKNEIANPRQSFINNFAANETPRAGNLPVDLSVKSYEGVLYPPNFVTSQTKKVKSELIKGTDYVGVYKYPEPVKNAGVLKVLVMDKRNFESFRAYQPFLVIATQDVSSAGTYPFLIPVQESYFVFVNNDVQKVLKKVSFSLNTFFRSEPPVIAYRSNPLISVPAGGSADIAGSAKDNAGISGLFCNINDADEWTDITGCYDASAGSWTYTVDAGKGGPAFCGEYKYMFKAVDFSGNESFAGPVFVDVNGARSFDAQKIYQDDAEEPLKRCSWILGPFRIVGRERFVDISTDSRSAGFDMDMHLYMDKNRNGRLDGPDEKFSQSTSPFPKERIFLEFPEDNMYWLYCQGWQVDTPPALLDVKLSFDYVQRFIVNYSPVGHVKTRSGEIKAEFKTPFGVRPETVKVFLNDADVTGACTVRGNEVVFMSGTPYEEAKTNKVKIQARDKSGNEDRAEWEFTADTMAPEVEALNISDGAEVAEKFSCSFRAADNVSVAKVVYSVDEAGGKELKKSDGKDEKDKNVYSGEISVLELPDGEHKLNVITADTAGNESKKEYKFTVKNPPICVASVSPGNGSKLSDDRPVVRIYIAAKKDINAKSIRMKFDGTDVSDRVRYSTKDNAKQVIYALRQSLEKGRHDVEFSVEDVDGNKIDGYKFSFEFEVPK